MNKLYAHAFLASKQWALDGAFLKNMVKVAMREEFNTLEALEGKSGRRISAITEIRKDVAILNVNGVVSRYSNLFQAICGGVSTELLAKEFNAALDNSAIKGIVLNIDSPGGEASGIHELSEMIFSARGRKPIHAYVGGDGCSAAYWIASACDRVTIDATARLGSIGTVLGFEKHQAADGVKSYEFVSSQSPNKRLDPDSEQGQQAIQQQLDDMSEVFIQRVARNMSTTRDKVIKDFGQGGVMIGQRAVDAGLAHELGSLEAIISKLSKGQTSPNAKTERTPFDASGSQGAWLTLDDQSPTAVMTAIREQFPDVISLLTPDVSPLSANAALDLADSVSMPDLARKLSTMTQENAEQYIHQAAGMRDVLAAAGMGSSFTVLRDKLDDPVQLVGMAIHEAKAYQDESADSSRHIADFTETPTSTINPDDIYNWRRES